MSAVGRRAFLQTLAAMPLAAEAALNAQPPQLPVIDSHIHLFDKSRPEGSPYPVETTLLGKNFQSALPARYRQVTGRFGVVGAIVIEAQINRPRIEDNQWVLDVAAHDPIIVGTVGRLDPASPDFGRNLERFHKDRLFLGIRQSQLAPGLENPSFMANLKLLADAGSSVDAIPANSDDAAMVFVRVTDKVPSLRLVINHYPNARLPEDRTAREAYLASLKELGRRPQVYVKLSEVVRQVGDRVSTDLSIYRDRLDQLWDIFGEDRVIFGSDWPQSENLELDSYPNVMSVARAYVMSKGPAAMEKVFWRNSVRAYHWVKRDPAQPA